MYLYKSEHDLMAYHFDLNEGEKEKKAVEKENKCICQGLDEYCKNCGTKIG